MPADESVFCISTFQFQRLTQTPDLDPISRFVAGNERRPHYRVRRCPAAGNGAGSRFRLILVSFELLRTLFNHGFKPRDVLNARFQLQPILFDYCFKSRIVLQQTIAAEAKEIITKFWILEVNFKQLIIGNDQHLTILNAFHTLRTPVIG